MQINKHYPLGEYLNFFKPSVGTKFLFNETKVFVSVLIKRSKHTKGYKKKVVFFNGQYKTSCKFSRYLRLGKGKTVTTRMTMKRYKLGTDVILARRSGGKV